MSKIKYLALVSTFVYSLNAVAADAYVAASENNRPNIVLIIADDMGIGDLGAFGGEINTPNLDKLASDGLMLTRFYSAPTCSPTRAMIFSGVPAHRAGLGNMKEFTSLVPEFENQVGKLGYEGYLNTRVTSISELLKGVGYQTIFAGKWHLGGLPRHAPSNRGFDQSFALIQGAASHFSDGRIVFPELESRQIFPDGSFSFEGGTKARYLHNGVEVSSLPSDYFSSDYFTDFVLKSLPMKKEQPFLAVLSFTAPHWPLQAPGEYIEKYKGKYDQGYDEIRESRLSRMVAKGLVPPSILETKATYAHKAWSKLSADEKRYSSKLMEVYAEMVDNMDENIGRLLEQLKKQDSLKNTVVIFLSDNGPEGTTLNYPIQGYKRWLEDTHDNSYENIGKEGSLTSYGPGWAQASSPHIRGIKAQTYEGGIRVPAIIYDGSQHNSEKTFTGQLSVLDIFPTIADLAQACSEKSKNVDPGCLQPVGKSFAELIRSGQRIHENSSPFITELAGKVAVVDGDKKAVISEFVDDKAKWELYDLSKDPLEQVDLSEKMPRVLADLKQHWISYIEANGVLPPKGQSW